MRIFNVCWSSPALAIVVVAIPFVSATCPNFNASKSYQLYTYEVGQLGQVSSAVTSVEIVPDAGLIGLQVGPSGPTYDNFTIYKGNLLSSSKKISDPLAARNLIEFKAFKKSNTTRGIFGLASDGNSTACYVTAKGKTNGQFAACIVQPSGESFIAYNISAGNCEAVELILREI